MNMLSSSINSGEFLICSIYSDILKDYKQKVPLVPVINDKLSGNEMLISSEVYSKYGGNIFQYRDYGPDNKTKEILNTEEVQTSENKTNTSSSYFLETSEEFYYKYNTNSSNQVSIYISSYAKTSQVLKKLEKKIIKL